MSIPYWPTPFLPSTPDPITPRIKKYKWVVKGWNCPVCTLFANRVATYQQWVIRPGFHTNCDCKLVPVADDTPITLFNFFGIDQYLYGNSFEAFIDYLFNKGFNWLGSWSEEFSNLAAEKGDLKGAAESMRPLISSQNPWIPLIPNWIILNPKINWLGLNSEMYGNSKAMMRNYHLPSPTLPWQQVVR